MPVIPRNFFVGLLTAGLLAVGLGQSPAVHAQAQTIDEVLRAVQAERRAVSETNQQREERFRREQANQEAELRRLRGEVQAAETEATRLENLRNQLDRELDELRAQLAERQGEFGELFGVARAAAASLNEELQDSLVSTQFTGRGDDLLAMARADRLPTIHQLENLWFTMLQEASEQGRVARFQAEVIGAGNQLGTENVVRIGPFAAFSERGFMIPSDGTLRYLARQPGRAELAAARRVFTHSGDGVVRGLIDPSQGALLGLVVEIPNLQERVAQGGGIGYAIMA